MRCIICGSLATQRHHCFANTKMNFKNYGKLLNAAFNLRPVCADCHCGHSNIPPDLIWSEEQFREEAIKNSYSLPAGSKVFQFKKWQRKFL